MNETQHKVLIIEDDEFLRSLAVTKLQKENFIVDIAVDGEEGINKILAFNPDAVLLDLMLPKLDGFGVLERMKADPVHAQTKVVVFSNLGEDADITRATTLGADTYLVKSNFTLGEMVETVKALLAQNGM